MQYLFVHGAWQGSWCWEPLAALVRAAGHKVACPDLPGHGASPIALRSVTYADYYQSLVDSLSNYKEPVVLVAHSMAGCLAAPLLDHYPERIAHLFLIAAFVPQQGESIMQLSQIGGPSQTPALLTIDYYLKTQSLDPVRAKQVLFGECSPEIATWAASRLQPQPMAAFTTPIEWSDSGKTQHKRTYLLCEEDLDVHPLTQAYMVERYPCRVIRLKSGHFPFLSQPKELCELLLKESQFCSI